MCAILDDADDCIVAMDWDGIWVILVVTGGVAGALISFTLLCTSYLLREERVLRERSERVSSERVSKESFEWEGFD